MVEHSWREAKHSDALWEIIRMKVDTFVMHSLMKIKQSAGHTKPYTTLSCTLLTLP